MDIFFEQLVKIKRTVKSTVLQALSFIAAVVLCWFCITYSTTYSVLILAAAAVIYGEYKLFGLFYKEYEYIITNGTVDIDCIVAKSKRSRIISFECSDILSAGKYSEKITTSDYTEKYICGNTENAYYFVVKRQGRKVLIVMSLNDKMLNAIKCSVPKISAVTVFGEI